MALVMCPECGKENISDTAITCPNCGYGIKEHFERIKQESEFVEQQRQKQEKLQSELKKELEKIDNAPRPYKPTLSSLLSQRQNLLAILFGVIAVLWLFLAIGYLFAGDSGSILYFLISAFFGAIAFVGGKSIKEDYKNALNKYENWDRDKERLKNDTINRYETWISNLNTQKFEAQKTTIPTEKVITPQPSFGLRCPNCNSPKVKRISTMSRAISVELVGLASSKIGKQYECLNCKHKW